MAWEAKDQHISGAARVTAVANKSWSSSPGIMGFSWDSHFDSCSQAPNSLCSTGDAVWLGGRELKIMKLQ